MKKNLITTSEAINQALHLSMKVDNNLICYGLGATDPGKIFGTAKNLLEKFGKDRIFDVPTSENALTGIGIGACVGGLRVVLSHQRLDFALLSLDQIINNAAKWSYMFGGNSNPISLTIRMIIGRGWGQGPTHAQSLQSLFAHIPGLKVVMPSSPSDAKGLLISSIFDPDPVIFLEHRWIHGIKEIVNPKFYKVPLKKCKKISTGDSLTIVTMSSMTIELKKIVNFLKTKKIYCDLIDLRTVAPIDYTTIITSIKKTNKILIVDSSHKNLSISSQISSFLSEKYFKFLEQGPQIISLPDLPVPTSHALTKFYYPGSEEIIKKILKMTDKNIKIDKKIFKKKEHDKPGDWFTGAF